jgi:hypothetical protein
MHNWHSVRLPEIFQLASASAQNTINSKTLILFSLIISTLFC